MLLLSPSLTVGVVGGLVVVFVVVVVLLIYWVDLKQLEAPGPVVAKTKAWQVPVTDTVPVLTSRNTMVVVKQHSTTRRAFIFIVVNL